MSGRGPGAGGPGRPPGRGPGGGGDPGRSAAPQPAWGPAEAAVGYVVGLVVSTLAASAWAGASHSTTGLGVTAAGLVGLWVGLAGAPLWACRVKGSGSLVTDFGLRVKALDVPLGVAIGLGAQLVLVPVLYLPFHLFDKNVGKQLGQPAQNLTGQAHGGGVALLALLVVVGAPVVEELFFRGLLLRSLRRRWGTAWAVAGSAVLFGLAHYEPLQLVALIAFGAVLGLLAVRTDRLGPGIFAHAAFNAVTVAVLITNR